MFVFCRRRYRPVITMLVRTCALMLHNENFRSLQFADGVARLIDGGLVMKRSEQKVGQFRMPSHRTPLSSLREEEATLGVDKAGSQWEEFASVCIEASYEKRETIFQDGVGPEYLLFITDGVCAGQATQPDGQTVVASFFEPRDFCAKIRFTRRGYTSTNTIVATTPVEGVLIPMDRW